jgi:hypothetical protein
MVAANKTGREGQRLKGLRALHQGLAIVMVVMAFEPLL